MKRDLRAKAVLLRVLGHPVRLAILMELATGPKCVMDIQELLDIRQTNVSQHLTALRHERIVDYHKDGKLRCYYVVRPGLIKALQRLVENDFPVMTRSKKAVHRAALRRRMEEGNTATTCAR